MYKTIIINDEILETAIRHVNELQVQKNEAKLKGVFDGATLGKIESMWESYTSALRENFIFGREYAQQKIDDLVFSVETLIKDAGKKARDFHNYFKTKLQEFVKALINAAFQFIPQSIDVGPHSFPISSISYNQKIALGGSLKASFLEAAELTASGEIEIGVEYAKA
ncbi:hypothetical protein SAMN04487898_105199 [Pedobacter sp. ok626]|uniref:hypothetical protein n=1 Tax=Pedobacter sp. ok626 TaxID=1761882 RepID=UPI0008884D04|nr:hypothetical protein [Pedobacter sp. ok626]SDJ97851.1 hypothetical protein SAMN04487898_105199 [Pedobacter sp. ok626]